MTNYVARRHARGLFSVAVGYSLSFFRMSGNPPPPVPPSASPQSGSSVFPPAGAMRAPSLQEKKRAREEDEISGDELRAQNFLAELKNSTSGVSPKDDASGSVSELDEKADKRKRRFGRMFFP